MSDPCWLTYIVRCRDGSFYTGVTNNIERRLAAHNSGRGCKYARGRYPVTLVYVESGVTKGYALRLEAAIKRFSRAEKLGLIRLGKLNAT